MIEKTECGIVLTGTEIKSIRKGKVNLVLIACDCSDRTKFTFKKEAEKCHIAIYEVLSIDEMSKAMGKTNKAVIGIKDIGFSKKMTSIIDGGEELG